jgi:hypothetical protein
LHELAEIVAKQRIIDPGMKDGHWPGPPIKYADFISLLKVRIYLVEETPGFLNRNT